MSDRTWRAATTTTRHSAGWLQQATTRAGEQPCKRAGLTSTPTYHYSTGLVDDLLADGYVTLGGFLTELAGAVRTLDARWHVCSGGWMFVRHARVSHEGAESKRMHTDVRSEACAAWDGSSQPPPLRVPRMPRIAAWNWACCERHLLCFAWATCKQDTSRLYPVRWRGHRTPYHRLPYTRAWRRRTAPAAPPSATVAHASAACPEAAVRLELRQRFRQQPLLC